MHDGAVNSAFKDSKELYRVLKLPFEAIDTFVANIIHSERLSLLPCFQLHENDVWSRFWESFRKFEKHIQPHCVDDSDPL
jgi:hypothetical protein